MARVKKKVYRVTYTPVDKDQWVSKGYSHWEIRRDKRRIKAYSDEQALAVANLGIPNIVVQKSTPVLWDGTPGPSPTVSYQRATITYRIEKLVEIIEREVQI